MEAGPFTIQSGHESVITKAEMTGEPAGQ